MKPTAQNDRAHVHPNWRLSPDAPDSTAHDLSITQWNQKQIKYHFGISELN